MTSIPSEYRQLQRRCVEGKMGLCGGRGSSLLQLRERVKSYTSIEHSKNMKSSSIENADIKSPTAKRQNTRRGRSLLLENVAVNIQYHVLVASSSEGVILSHTVATTTEAIEMALTAFLGAVGPTTANESDSRLEYESKQQILYSGGVLASRNNQYYAMVTAFTDDVYKPLTDALKTFTDDSNDNLVSDIQSFLRSNEGLPLSYQQVESILDMALFYAKNRRGFAGLLYAIAKDWRFISHTPLITKVITRLSNDGY